MDKDLREIFKSTDMSPIFMKEDELLEKIYDKFSEELYKRIYEDIQSISDSYYNSMDSRFIQMKEKINDFINSKNIYTNKLEEIEGMIHHHSIGVQRCYEEFKKVNVKVSLIDKILDEYSNLLNKHSDLILSIKDE